MPPTPADAAGTGKSRFKAVPIEQVRVGQRVESDNPTNEFDHTLGDDIDPAGWRELQLRASKRDGSWADIVLLRPLWWLDKHQARAGGTLAISVPECGIDGNAEVEAIGPARTLPPDQAGWSSAHSAIKRPKWFKFTWRV